MEIKTRRTILRILEVADVQNHYVDWLNNPDINRYLESRFVTHTLDSTREFVHQIEEDDTVFLFGIFIDNKHIGNIKLGPVLREHKRANIGILIGERDYWGRGIAVEVIKAVANFAFSELCLEKIDAGCYESHIASKTIFMRAGFSVESLLPGHVICDGKREGVYLFGLLANRKEMNC